MAKRFSVMDSIWFGNSASARKRAGALSRESASFRIALANVRKDAERRARMGAIFVGFMVPVALTPMLAVLLA